MLATGGAPLIKPERDGVLEFVEEAAPNIDVNIDCPFDSTAVFEKVRLVVSVDGKAIKIIWQNPTPYSVRFCRPIRARFVHETKDVTKEEIEYIENQAKYLIKTKDTATSVKISHNILLTMVDGKMSSRSKLILELVAQKNDDSFRNFDHIVNENIESINEIRNYSNENQDTTQNSDDSVKDPDYQDPTLLPENLSLSVFEHLNSSPSSFVYENLSPSIFEQENLLSDIEHANSTPPLTKHENSTPPLSEQQNLIPTEPGIVVIETPIKKGKKRLRQESNWKKNVAKMLRNSGVLPII
ncbi:unnamed protein product [Diabrotica balteata]|uniref:Uncharacterized protein n=1 Tax=Diabrotica balteata TaxID=107213 RepID=A0A9N9XI25_DIABA|nr:unnamed protein product [Diabrotica balteata]